MAATPQYLVRKHHPVRGCYERYLICSDHLLRTVDPASLTTTNTYPCAASLSAPHSLLKELTHAHTPSRRIRDVRLMDTPSDGGAVRLRVPSRFFCGLLEELELSVVNPEEHAPLLGTLRAAIAAATPAFAIGAARFSPFDTPGGTMAPIADTPAREAAACEAVRDAAVAEQLAAQAAEPEVVLAKRVQPEPEEKENGAPNQTETQSRTPAEKAARALQSPPSSAAPSSAAPSSQSRIPVLARRTSPSELTSPSSAVPPPRRGSKRPQRSSSSGSTSSSSGFGLTAYTGSANWAASLRGASLFSRARESSAPPAQAAGPKKRSPVHPGFRAF
jgi:hypothetical protein